MADQIEEVKQKTDIVSLIGEYIEIKKAGRNYKALCPFHSEKTPSFMISPELQIYKCFGCFPAGQFIKTPFGPHKIEDVVDNEYVISGSAAIRKVITTHNRNYNGDLVTVKISRFNEQVSLTGDHMIYVVGGKPTYSREYKNLSRRLNYYSRYSDEKRQNLVWKYFPVEKIEARELRKGMSVLYPINTQTEDIDMLDLSKYILKKWPPHGTKPIIPPLDIKVDTNFLKLIGYYIAEGSNHRAYIRFSLGDHEKKFAEEIIFLIKRIFRIDAKISYRAGSTKTGIEISACNSILADVFGNLCGKGAGNKHIPFIFQHLPKSKQITLLDAIFKGDGTQGKIGIKNKTLCKSITTISRTLAEQLIDILLRVGYFPSKHLKRNNVDKLGVNHKDAFTVSWVTDSRRSKIHHFYKDKDGHVSWIVPVRYVEKRKFSGKVYNLTVDQDHSYVANGFAVANCGAAGDVYAFLKEYEGMEFGEALKFLADRAGVKLQRISRTDTSEKEKIIEINNLTSRFYQYLLFNSFFGKVALDYLLKGRGLKLATIKEFGLGFSPDSPLGLKKFLIDKKKFSPEAIEGAGIGYPKGGYFIDRLRGRVIFPLLDHRGNTVGFAGRVLPGPNEGETAKYINTPETSVYHKSSLLYGLNLTKQNIKRKNVAIVVEGELDAISSWQAGIQNVVALKGSALTGDQVRLISRFCKKAILCLDSDIAGDSAARRGVITAQDQGLEVKVARLKDFKDPDDAARKNPEGYKKSLIEAVGIWDFLIDSVFERFDAKSGEGKAKISREVVPVLSLISDKIVQDHYVNAVSKRLEVSAEAVLAQVSKQAGKKESSFARSTSLRATEDEEKRGRRELLEERILSLGFRYNPEILLKKSISDLVKTPLSKRILDEYLIYSQKKGKFNVSEFGTALPKELFDGFARMVLSEESEIGSPNEIPIEEGAVLHELRTLSLKEKLVKLSEEIRGLEEEGGKTCLPAGREKLAKAEEEFKNLTEKLHSLEEKTKQGIILDE